MKPIPSISVIIPVYNAENYIRQCLGSVLTQSFQDFEAIIVDDCSTDRSFEICQEMSKKFNGRMKLAKLRKNSGSPGEPRNTGLCLARGEYVTFLDNDDVIMPNALEIFFKSAQETHADVVHTEGYFLPEGKGDVIHNGTKLLPVITDRGERVKNPSLIPGDMKERVDGYINYKFFWHIWGKLFRRDFLMTHNIRFDEFGYDIPFSFFCLCLAERYAKIPELLYVWRMNQKSISHSSDGLSTRYLSAYTIGVRAMESFMDGIDFFNKNPDYRFSVMNFFVQTFIKIYSQNLYKNMSTVELDAAAKNFFRRDFGENAAIVAYFFDMVNIYKNRSENFQARIAELEKQIKIMEQKGDGNGRI